MKLTKKISAVILTTAALLASAGVVYGASASWANQDGWQNHEALGLTINNPNGEIVISYKKNNGPETELCSEVPDINMSVWKSSESLQCANLPPGEAGYSVFVKVNNSAFPTKGFVIDKTAPGINGLHGTGSNGKVALGWNQATDNKHCIKELRLVRNGAVINILGSGNTSWNDTQIPVNSSFGYNYQVQAIDCAGNAAATSVVNASFAYVPPRVDETPAATVDPNQEKSTTGTPNGTNSNGEEPRGEVKGEQKAAGFPWTKVAAASAGLLGVVGAALFWILRRKEKGRVIEFETTPFNSTYTPEPKVETVEETDDDLPIA